MQLRAIQDDEVPRAALSSMAKAKRARVINKLYKLKAQSGKLAHLLFLKVAIFPRKSQMKYEKF